MSSLITTLAIAALSLQTASAALTACPGQDRSWRAGNGPNYLICANTDYHFGGRSLQIVQSVASTDACAKICANDTRCERAVYDKTGKICHVKDVNSGTRMPWEASTQFDTIRIDTVKLAEGVYTTNEQGGRSGALPN